MSRRLHQVALVAAVVGWVLSAPPQSGKVHQLPGAGEHFEAAPELLPAIEKQEDHSGEGSVKQGSHAPVRQDIEDSLSSVGTDDAPLSVVTYTSTDDGTSSALLSDSPEKIPGGEEAGTATQKLSGDDVESERRLPGLLPPDLAETEEGPANLQAKGEAEIIAEIESILGKVREQYTKNDQSLSVPVGEGGISSHGQAAHSINDLLKLSTSQMDDETVQEDPVIEKARNEYMSIWNQEAERLNAPYMRVTKAWPELGIVYMPVVTEVTDQIKASAAVKEAAGAFKKVWEERVTEADDTKATVEPMLKVLNNFMSAWLWAENADQETAAGVVDGADHEEQPQKRTGVERSKAQKTIQGNPFLENNFVNDLESQLRKLYENIFSIRQPQPTLGQPALQQPTLQQPTTLQQPALEQPTLEQPNLVTKSTDLIKASGSGKIMLSCSVVPEESLATNDPPPADSPIDNNIPVNNPVADIRPIIDPFRALNAIKTALPNIQQLADHGPLSNPPGALRSPKDPIGASRPVSRPRVSPIAYSRPFLSHEVDTRPITRPEAAAPLGRYHYTGRTADQRYPLSSDASHSLESEEAFGRRYASQQPWRQYPWLH